jgi:hypothetical protein
MKSPESIVEPKASTAGSSDHPATPDIGALVSYFEHDAQPTIVLDPVSFSLNSGSATFPPGPGVEIANATA